MYAGIKVIMNISGEKSRKISKPISIIVTSFGIGFLNVIEYIAGISQTVKQVRKTVGRVAKKKDDFLNLLVIVAAIYYA